MVSRIALVVVRRLYKALLRRNIQLLGTCPYHGVPYRDGIEQHYIGCEHCRREAKAAYGMSNSSNDVRANRLFKELEHIS